MKRLNEFVSVTAIICLLFLVTPSINYYIFSKAKKDGKSLYTDGNSTYLMTSLDSYYFLRLSKEYINGTYDDYDELGQREFPRPIPLLSWLLVFAYKITHINLEKLAFFIPPFLAASSVFVFFFWGRLFGGNINFIIASLIFSTSFYWFIRTCIGRFDTDAFNLVFLYILSFFVLKFVTEEKIQTRFLYFSLYWLLSLVFINWWTVAKYLVLVNFFLPYSLSLFFYKSNKIEKYIKIAVILSLVLVFLIFISNLYTLLPESIKRYFSELHGLIQLIQKREAGTFADIGSSISELIPVTIKQFFYEITSHPILFIVSLIGFVLLFLKHYREIIFLTVPLILSLSMFIANRFAIFYLPIFALSVGYFCYFLYNSYPLNKQNLLIRVVILFIFLSILVGINLNPILKFTPPPAVTYYDVMIAKKIKEISGKDATIFAQWDYGYFLQYYTNRKTLVDGGSQNPDRVFITSFPLSVPDQKISSHLMKFFAQHSTNGLYHFLDKLKDLDKLRSFFYKVYSHDNIEEVFKEYNLIYNESYKDYLFPKNEVYLYLNQTYFNKGYWWYYFSTYSQTKKTGHHPFIFVTGLHNAKIDKQKGILSLDANLYQIREILFYEEKQRIGVTHKIVSNNEKGLILLIAVKDNLGFLTDINFSNTVFYYLFFFNPIINNPYFQTISYIPLESGFWKVK